MSVRGAALACWMFTVVVAVLAVVLLVLGPGRSVPDDLFGGVGGAASIALSLAFSTVGALVASRAPENRVAWVFCVIGVLTGTTMLAYQYANYGLHATAEPLPGATVAAWLSVAPSEAGAGLLGLALLLFPDGRLPSRRWRPAAAAAFLSIALLLVSSSLSPGSLGDPFAEVSSPLGIPGAGSAMTALDIGGWVFAVAGIALGAAATLTRRRRARGVQRQQVELVLAVGAVVAIVTTLDMATWLVWPEGNLQLRMCVIGASFSLFPVAAGVAILRYRLYDIDVVINRTLVYAALTATLAGAYIGLVLLLQLALSPGSDLAIAASTLAVAALFRPARLRIQGLVDRRFYRRKYDAQQTLEGFGVRLRDEVDLEALGWELRDVVAATMQPAHISLWLRHSEAER